MKNFLKHYFLIQIVLVSGELSYHVKIHLDPTDDSCIVIQHDEINYRGFTSENKYAVEITQKSAILEDQNVDFESPKIIEIYGRDKNIVNSHVQRFCNFLIKKFDPLPEKFAPEVVKIVDSGDPQNRIDVVFMGDGYQLDERQEFFDDISRLTKDMFEGETFSSYLPLFNVWAIFEESVDSGIGYDNGAKNTPFKLYRRAIKKDNRAGTQLRAIYTGAANHARQVCQLTGPGACDYPSLIANDDFYGGLGGEFVISTRSNRSGTIVLRHEMGHSFINVGDEYDSSPTYYGVNSASSVATLGWSHWLTTEARRERAIYRLLEYPWANLMDGPVSLSFLSDGTFNRWFLEVTVSAAAEEDSMEFLMDGVVLPWTTTGFDDREFYTWRGDYGFSSGPHNFTVRSKTNATNEQIPRMICSVKLHELGSEEEYHSDLNYISAYPTWGNGGGITFRPTSDGCLMRNMSHPLLCSVCKEGMWYEFLKKVSLIDKVEVANATNPDGTRIVILKTLQLGQLRSPGNEIEGETLLVKWLFSGVEQPQFTNEFEINADPGSWTVQIQFITPEVRNDPNGLLFEEKTFIV